jgi:phospholipid-binding lipoprotein MlaA
MDSPIRAWVPALCLVLLAGCAVQPPAKPDPRDPWERMNRVTYKFNDKLDKAVLRPVARTYVKVTPGLVQTGVRNFFSNLNVPLVMANDLLQGQFKPFVNDTVRLVMNTTIGVGGLFDPASHAGLDRNDRDFGQTFGKWGVKPGPYVVLPLFGPSDVRDTFGKVADAFSDPRNYLRNDWAIYGLWAVGLVNLRAQLLPASRLVDSAYDPYAFVRNAYLQNRAYKVQGSNSESEEEREQKLLEEAGEDQETPPAAAPPQTPPKTAPPQGQEPPPTPH